jgi:hypothetical protein
MKHPFGPRALRAAILLLGAPLVLVHCSSSSAPETGNPPSEAGGDGSSGSCSVLTSPGVDASTAEFNKCFPDHDGITGGNYTFDVTVDDTGFSKTIISTQNDAAVSFTLTNKGTKPHGFEVNCISVFSGNPPAYTSVPKGCPTVACFPSNSTIAPLQPGESKTITFDTPTPDGLLYPFRSSEPADWTVPGLNGCDSSLQWNMM